MTVPPESFNTKSAVVRPPATLFIAAKTGMVNVTVVATSTTVEFVGVSSSCSENVSVAVPPSLIAVAGVDSTLTTAVSSSLIVIDVTPPSITCEFRSSLASPVSLPSTNDVASRLKSTVSSPSTTGGVSSITVSETVSVVPVTVPGPKATP